jgi:hypothetical protein
MISSVLLLWLLSSADGPELGLPRTLGLEEPRLRVPLALVQEGSSPLGFTLAAQGRAALPYGSADRGTIVAGGTTITVFNRLAYSDIFNVGWGVTLEADLMWRPPPPHAAQPLWARPVEMGAYLAFEYDWFDGSDTRDDSGTTIRPASLRLPQIFVGFKAAGAVRENFFGDIRVGLGAAHFPSLGATFTPPGSPDLHGELFAETWTFAMALRFHFGWDLGPVGIVFGMGGRLIAPPNRGTSSSLDPAALYTIDFEIGVEIGF